MLLRSLVMVVVLIMSCGCVSSPTSVAANSAEDSIEWRVVRPIQLRRVGESYVLIPEMAVSPKNVGQSAGTLENNTLIQASGSRKWDTMTRGTVEIPYARILTGRFKGLEVSIAHKDLNKCLVRVSKG